MAKFYVVSYEHPNKSFALKAKTERAAKLEASKLRESGALYCARNADIAIYSLEEDAPRGYCVASRHCYSRWIAGGGELFKEERHRGAIIGDTQEERERRKAEQEEREAARKEKVKQDAPNQEEDKEDTLLAKVKGEGITMEQVRKSYLTLAKEGKGERAIKACAEVFEAAKTAEIQAARDAGKYVGKLLTEQEFDGDFVSAVDAALSIKSAKIDVRGCYLWVSNTKREDLQGRETLKSAGFYWAPRRKAWYWMPSFLKHHA